MQNSQNELEEIGLKAVSFLSDNADYLGRFLNHSGMSVDELKNSITERGLQIGLLDFLFSDESLLMMFCSAHNIDPASLQKLHAKLNYTE